MVDFRHLVEARVRDYYRRKAAGEVKPRADEADDRNLETILLSEIRELRHRARSVTDPEQKKALLDRSTALETQLLVLLETTGRPLAAKLWADRLRAESRASSKP